MKKKSSTAPKVKTDQFTEFVAAVIRQLPQDLDPELVQKCIKKQDFLATILRRVFKEHNCVAVSTTAPYCINCGAEMVRANEATPKLWLNKHYDRQTGHPVYDCVCPNKDCVASPWHVTPFWACGIS